MVDHHNAEAACHQMTVAQEGAAVHILALAA